MDTQRSFQLVEYDHSGAEVARTEQALVDPTVIAAERLKATGATETGRTEAPDVTAGFGPLLWARWPTRTGRWPAAVAWVRETEPPWRSAWGVALRSRRRTYFVGLGRRTGDPRSHDDGAPEVDLPQGWNTPTTDLAGPR